MKRLKRVDRLSELPESLILKILSFLEMRDIVKTSLISKRWKDLWIITPYLYFNESKKNAVQTRNFINRVLLHWKGTKILKFKIRFGKVYDASLSGDVDFWMSFATAKKVEELYIHLPYHYPLNKPLKSYPVYYPPQCLYSCSSITKLWLIGYNLQINGNVQWEKLKWLKIYGYCMSEDVINKVVSSTPQLEILDLWIFGIRPENLCIQSSSLKSLSLVKKLRYDKYDPPNYARLTIWAPNLEALEIYGFAYTSCLLMDVSSLKSTTLRFEDTCDVALGETLKQILRAIQHVEALTLSLRCFKMLGEMKGKYSFSIAFTNVKILKFISGPIEPYDIVDLVEIFPNVEKLLIDWKCHTKFLANLSEKHDTGENYLELEAKKLKPFLMQLRTVEITWYKYEAASIFLLIKFLLKHATMLRKIVQNIVIKKGGRNCVVESEDLALAAEELQSLQRSFPSVDLIFCKK